MSRKGRREVPARCNRRASWWQAKGGMRLCARCMRDLDFPHGFEHVSQLGPDDCIGPCDNPSDGLGALRMLPLAERGAR